MSRTPLARLGPKGPSSLTPAWIALALAVLTVGLYARVAWYDFVLFDDPEYVSNNRYVLAGLTWDGIRWAFVTFHFSNWHPLTWLSHMADVELFGPAPGGHHVTNLVLHVGNTVLLLFVLRRLTGRLWRSAFVAALFAIHPLHVESVAWIAERKDLLSAFFGLLTLWLYAAYAGRTTPARYAAVVGAFALGLMAKPMLVTLPVVLLLLDYWPLGRLGRRAVLEKLPLLALSAVSCVLTVLAHQQSAALPGFEAYPLDVRIGNALIAYATYVLKTLWPSGLAVFYPHPKSLLVAQACVAAIVLLALGALALRRPWTAVGWLWFVGMMVPVIGLLQVGRQSMADRYTYLPSIGLFIAGTWAGAELMGPRLPRAVLAWGAAMIVGALTAVAWPQVGYWRDSGTLFERAVAVTERNALALTAIGDHHKKAGDLSRAVTRYKLAIAADPGYAIAHNNLGNTYRSLGLFGDARRELEAAIRADEAYASAHYNLGGLMLELGECEPAIGHFRRALELAPTSHDSHTNLATCLVQLGAMDEALPHFREAVRLAPHVADTHYNLGWALSVAGRLPEATANLERALEIDPRHGPAVRRLEEVRAGRER